MIDIRASNEPVAENIICIIDMRGLKRGENMKKDNMIRSGKNDSQYCDCKNITCGYNHSRTCVVNGTGNTPNAGRRCEGYTFEILECFSRLFPMASRLLAIAIINLLVAVSILLLCT